MTNKSRLVFAILGLGTGAFLGLSTTGLQGQGTTATSPPKEIYSYRDVVKRVLPAVVSLEAKKEKKPKGDKPAKPEDDETLGTGSGVITDATGVIVTNYHVIEGATHVIVTLSDGRKFDSTDIRRDPKTDLAVLRVKSDRPLPSLEFVDSDTIEVGDRVLAIGSPFGLSGSVTHGIISAKGRNNQRINQYEDFLQTDAAMNPGNSGGALVGLDGKIVGINSNIRSTSGGFQGIGLAISANLAKEVSRQLLESGSVKRGYLGIGIRELDPAAAEKLGIKTGVIVAKVYDNTPASKAGLKTGDVIVSIGGIALRDSFSLPRTVAMMPLNKPSDVAILRDGKPLTLAVTILEQPEEFGQDRSSSGPLPKGAGLDIGAGITVMILTDELAKSFNYPKGTRGVVVGGVTPDSPAATAGITRGMILQKIGSTAVTTPEKAEKTLSETKDKTVSFEVVKPNGEIDFITVVLKP